jgi:hypothetical protein
MITLSTQELKDFINEIYDRVKPTAEKENVYEPLNISFAKNTPYNQPGDYSYSDENGYYYGSIGDRGETFPESATKSLFEISYWVIRHQIHLMSSKFARTHQIQGQDFRRVMFDKMIQYWGIIGSEYAECGKNEIVETLKENPFID